MASLEKLFGDGPASLKKPLGAVSLAYPRGPLTAFFYTAARDVAPLTDGLRIGEARNELSASIR
jgi:hypothetical protein